jgi:ketosteroid isomerase-like protein
MLVAKMRRGSIWACAGFSKPHIRGRSKIFVAACWLVFFALAASDWCHSQQGHSAQQTANEPVGEAPLDDPSRHREIADIKSLLAQQDECWNRGDLEGFMQTYWNSTDLTFSGGGKTTRGWQATLDRYKKNYPREKMGKLAFNNLEVTILAPTAALVLGDWHLDLEGQKRDGNFTLVLRKFDGAWKIVHDHSSYLEPEKTDGGP